MTSLALGNVYSRPFLAHARDLRLADFLAVLSVYQWSGRSLGVLLAPEFSPDPDLVVDLVRPMWNDDKLLSLIPTDMPPAVADDATAMFDWLFAHAWTRPQCRSGEPHLALYLAAVRPVAVLEHVLATAPPHVLESVLPKDRDELADRIRKNTVPCAQDTVEVLDYHGLLNDAGWSAVLCAALRGEAANWTPCSTEFVAERLDDWLQRVVVATFSKCISWFNPETRPHLLLAFARTHLADDAPMLALASDLASTLSDRVAALHGPSRVQQTEAARDLKHVFSSAHAPASLWDMLLLANACVAQYAAASCTALAWVPAAALLDLAERDRAVALMRDTDTAPLFLGVMLSAQIHGRVGRHAVKLSAHRNACGECPLSAQQAWQTAVARLLAAFPRATREIPLPVVADLLGLLKSVPDLANARPTSAARLSQSHTPSESAPCRAACQAVKHPLRETVRQLADADLAGLLDVLAGDDDDGTTYPLAFWRAVPDGKLDRVRDATWVARAVVAAREHGVKVGDREGAREVVKEIRRVAGKMVAGAEYAEAMVAVLHE
ncbi:hypothetical protein H9P43_007399 [Blastocladiella emersonii ATCC 22665]|nr:hypothetical protein H9P43_007399 [Blastocladiella emersonii ATCC 22665]